MRDPRGLSLERKRDRAIVELQLCPRAACLISDTISPISRLVGRREKIEFISYSDWRSCESQIWLPQPFS